MAATACFTIPIAAQEYIEIELAKFSDWILKNSGSIDLQVYEERYKDSNEYYKLQVNEHIEDEDFKLDAYTILIYNPDASIAGEISFWGWNDRKKD